MMRTVTTAVYLNESRDHFFGYQAGHQLTRVSTFEQDTDLVARTINGVPVQALEAVFRELNDEPTESWAVEYRRNRNRSLSVGDVVAIGEVAYAVASIGWDRVSLTNGQIAFR